MSSVMKKFVVTALMVCLLATGSLFAQQMAALININTADEATLATIEHVGKVRAQAIIQYRQENGSFKTVEDLRGCLKNLGCSEPTEHETRHREINHRLTTLGPAFIIFTQTA